jgi:RNA polymerase sigma factor (TIGR02999 family)
MNAESANLTQLLRDWRAGHPQASEQLMPLVYRQLHAIAARNMRQERPDHTLCATALVHEAYLRLAGADISWQNRMHFLAVAATTMRRILVDHAKARLRAKRGGGAPETSLDAITLNQVAAAGPNDPVDILDLDRALALLSKQDARKAQLLELFYFAGVDCEEAAGVLEISIATVNRDLRLARAWLRHALQSPPADPGG